MSSDDSLLDQADALMRRHRVFVAGAQAEAAEAEPAPGLDNGSDASSDDLPLLTEVAGAGRPVAADLGAAADGRLRQLLAEHRAALALELENWLDEQLPQLVIRAMDGITDHLVALITNRAREELLPLLDAILRPSDEAVPQWPKAAFPSRGMARGHFLQGVETSGARDFPLTPSSGCLEGRRDLRGDSDRSG